MSERIFSKKYHIQREIARGGMGTIYQAIDLTLRREVAIKVLHAHYSGDPSFARRFLGEARGMARLDHPNIVRVYAVEKEEEAHYIVMEYFPGQDLKHVLRERGPLPLPKALHYAIEITRALGYAHQKNIVHRDIKPGNVLVDEQDKVKITDFGIAAALDESSATLTGTIMGTPEYMSPEQAKGERVDAGSDLFSLGIVFYEMLVGKTPYEGLTGASIVGKLAYDQAELNLVFPSSVPPSLQYLIRGLTKKELGARLKDATLVSETLQHHSENLESSSSKDLGVEPTIVSPPPSKEPPPLPPQIPSEPEHKTETPSPPQPAASDRGPQKEADHLRKRRVPNRALVLGMTGSLFLVGVIVLILYTLPLPVEKDEEKIEPPRQEAQEKLQQGTAVIKELTHLQQEYTNELTRQQDTTQGLVANLDSLQAKLKNIRLQAARESNRQEIETASERLVALSQEVEQEKARQQKIRQDLSPKTQETLKKADTTTLGEIDKPQRDKIKTARTEIITAQKRLKDQQSSLQKKLEAKIATVTAALAETKGVIAEAKRRETEALAKAKAQHEKEEAARQGEVTATISKLNRLNRELQEAHAQHEGKRQTLLGESDMLLATIQDITPTVDSERSKLQLEAAKQGVTHLRQQISDEQTRQEASAQTRSEKVAAVLTEIAQVSQGKLEGVQRRALQETQGAIEAANQRLNEQQASFIRDSYNKLTTLDIALERKKYAMADVIRQKEETEAENVAALEEAKRNEELERQSRLKKQQLVALQRKTLEEKLDHFRSAYENHDLFTLKQTTSMDGRRINQVKLMFNAYPTIEIVTEIQAITDEGASARIVITKLVDQTGQNVTPSPIIRETIVRIPKEGDTWGKIQW